MVYRAGVTVFHNRKIVIYPLSQSEERVSPLNSSHLHMVKFHVIITFMLITIRNGMKSELHSSFGLRCKFSEYSEVYILKSPVIKEITSLERLNIPGHET